MTCKQCGRNIHSNLCAEFCDQDIRQKQFEEETKKVNEFFDKSFPKLKSDKK